MEHVLEVSNLKKSFKNIHAVDDVNFHVETGQLYGFLGVNGAGKSTTIHMLCTLLPEDQGQVTICGYTLGKENEAIRRHIGVVFQDNSLDDRLTVHENLFIRASLYHNDRNFINKNINEVSEILGINDLLKRQFRFLSGGQKRRCEVAKSLMNAPDLLFLDEPTTGLDPQSRQTLWDIIDSLRGEKKMTVFLTTHYMEEAAKAQYITILDAGKVVANGTPSSLKQEFAKDQAILFPRDMEKMINYLHHTEYPSEIKSNHICVTLPDTLTGLRLLTEVQEELLSCELIQGSMDDVFLNITGRSL